MHHFFHGQTPIQNPLFKFEPQSNGVDYLDPNLTINGITVTPDFRYKGNDAGASTWAAWNYGTILNVAGSGTAPVLNNGFPCFPSANNDSVKFGAGKFYQDSGTTTGDITTEDFVLEFIVTATSTNTEIIAGKRNAAAGWQFYTVSGAFLLFISDSSGHTATITTSAGFITTGAWYHIIVFADRSGSMQMYINGNTAWSAIAISSVLTMTNVVNTDLGASAAGFPVTGNIAYAALWKQSSWLDTHLQPNIAMDRFTKLCGVSPPKSVGSGIATSTNRTTIGYLRKNTGGITKLYKTGAYWLRTEKRSDCTGFLSEHSATNLCLQSEAFGTTWTVIDAGDTISSNSAVVLAPDGNATADGIVADSSDNQHGVSQDITLTATVYTFSVHAKAGNKNWVYMENTTVANAWSYFDLSNGVVGSKGAGASASTIENLGNGWYRCSFSYTGTVAAHTHRISPADADNDNVVTGDGSTVNTWLWGAQVERNALATSYIPTTTVSVARDFDYVVFAASNNISTTQGTAVGSILIPNHVMDIKGGFVMIDDSTTSNRMQLNSSSSQKMDWTGVASSTTQWNITDTNTDVSNGIRTKVAGSWNTNEAKEWINGIREGTNDASVTVPTGLSRIVVGLTYDGSGVTYTSLNGTIESLKIFNRSTIGLSDGIPTVDNLNPSLTINGTTVTPTLRYKGGDASASGFPQWTYGQSLVFQSAGTDPSYNQPSAAILTGVNDRSVQFNAGDFFQASASSYADVGTEDIVVELILKGATTNNSGYLAKRNTSNQGFNLVFQSVNKAIRMNIADASAHSTAIESAVGSIQTGTWYHVMLFVRRASNMQWFVNGVASGIPIAVSSILTLTGLGSISISALRDGGTILGNGGLAYVAMWIQGSWLDTEQQANVAAGRYASLTRGKTLI